MRFPFGRKRLPKGGEPGLDTAYRLHRRDDTARYTTCATEVFPEKAGLVECFGADWMGRQFALDHSRLVSGEPQVALLDPETREIFEIPCGYRDFHEVELFQHPNETVEYDRFQKWLSSGGRAPEYSECVCFKTPLFLGGKDTFDNLIVTDLEVYWTINGQILTQIRTLPEKTVVSRFAISDD